MPMDLSRRAYHLLLMLHSRAFHEEFEDELV
jgi:hypothetical protein